MLHPESIKIDETEVKEYYKFPFKMATYEEIFESAEKRDENSMYVKLDVEYRGDMAIINFMIIDCETGMILSRCNLGGLTKVSLNLPSGNHLRNQHYMRQSINPTSEVFVSPYDGTGFGHVGPEIAALYRKKAKIQKVQFKQMCSQSAQLKRNSKLGLMIY